MPLKVSGITAQSGRRNGAASRITAQTASPITGTASSSAGNFRFGDHIGGDAAIRMAATMATRTHSIAVPGAPA